MEITTITKPAETNPSPQTQGYFIVSDEFYNGEDIRTVAELPVRSVLLILAENAKVGHAWYR